MWRGGEGARDAAGEVPVLALALVFTCTQRVCVWGGGGEVGRGLGGSAHTTRATRCLRRFTRACRKTANTVREREKRGKHGNRGKGGGKKKERNELWGVTQVNS